MSASTLRRLGAAAIGLFCALMVAMPAAAQPSFVGVQTARTGPASTSLTINVPSGAAGDLLVAILGVGVNPSTATPAGWTAVSGFSGFNEAICASEMGIGIRCQLSVFYRFASGASSPASVNFTWGAQVLREAAGAVLRYSNTNDTDPIGPTASQSGTSGSPSAPAITTDEDDQIVLRILLSDANGLNSTMCQGAACLPTSNPATERFELASRSPLNFENATDAVILTASEQGPFTNGTNVGTASWTLVQTSDQFRAATIAIRPPATILDTDLAVTKDDDPDKVNPGGSLDYTVTVSNNGPNDVTGASLTDSFDSDLTCTWTCSAAGASACGGGAGAGDINETIDVAVGDNVTFDVSCTVDGGASGSIPNTATVAVPMGFNDTDGSNDSDSTSTPVNQAPMAVCQDVELVADEMDCLADVDSSADFDGGSSDPDGDLPLAFSHAPLGPYGLGDTGVTLTVEDALGLTDSCSATVGVVDNAAPFVECNDPGTIVPPDAPISFTATGTDACGPVTVEILGYDCFKFTNKGMRIDKTASCVVEIVGDTITIHDSGGVGTSITWVAKGTDTSDNMLSINCGVQVVNPGQS